MAWCPHCNEDRPIQRQIFDGVCSYCGRGKASAHQQNCRAPVPGALDVCSFCNTHVFAKAKTENEYQQFAQAEGEIKKSACFVVTATMGNPSHPVVCDMRRFRDEMLITNNIGTAFIEWYYNNGPKLATIIEKHNVLRALCFTFLILPTYVSVRTIFLFRNVLGMKKRS